MSHGMLLWARIGIYTAKSDVRRDAHRSAVPSSPCKNHYHV